MSSGRAHDQQDRIDMMFRAMGLDPYSRPFEPSTASLFREPAKSSLYEADLVQAQRQMRAQAARQSTGEDNPAPRKARRLDRPTSLPRMDNS